MKGKDQRPEENRCGLCGLPVGKSTTQGHFGKDLLRFCCSGCLSVYQILAGASQTPPVEFKETELYRICVASGLIARSEEDPHPIQATGYSGRASIRGPASPATEEDLAKQLTVRLEGMWCTACAWLIEQMVRRSAGVLEARVVFLSDLAHITYLPHCISPNEILGNIEKLGYRASRLDPDGESTRHQKGLLVRLGVCTVLTMNIMMISFALYGGFFKDMGDEAVPYFSYPLAVMATPVVFYGGWPIMRRAFLGLLVAAPSMDTLICVGSLSAYFYSLVALWQGSLHVYFDTSAMLVTVVLFGRYIEARAREKVSRGIHELYQLVSRKVRLCSEGRERWVAADAVEEGAELLVLPGERVPLDGQIVSGRAMLDESILTGESRPVGRAEGDEVLGGGLVLDGELRLKAIRTAGESFIGRMIGLLHGALSAQNPVELMADRITRWFVPAILVLACSSALYLGLSGASAEEAVLRAVTVLVITCPCALGIAAPLAKVASIEKARRNGVLIRDPLVLERAREIDTLVFDKTGTLTEGRFTLRQVIPMRSEQQEPLRRLASVEAHSDHFLAREIQRNARDAGIALCEVSRFASLEGLGVKAQIDSTQIVIGNRRLMEQEGVGIPKDVDTQAEDFESEGSTVVFFAWDGALEGLLVFGDVLKEGAYRIVSELSARRVLTLLVSGDSQKTTRAVARQLGIEDFTGKILPAGKVEIIRELQKQGRVVGMVGDGLNDAAALAQADVGFALGADVDLIREASDVTLLRDDPAMVLHVLDLSGLATRIIRQNIFFACVYNLLGIPLAVTGLLNPLVAVSAMAASSLTVVVNTMRIARN